MASISSLGVGSGIDLNTILTKLMAVESIPLNQIDAKQASYKNQLSAIGRIQSAVSDFSTAASAIGTSAAFQGFQATVTDSAYATATAASYAAPGTFSLVVDQLAQANKLQSSVNPTVSTGTLQIELGNISTPPFVAKSGTSPIMVNFTGTTIDDLRTAINDAHAGVTATVVNGSAGKQLMLTSSETGASNTIRLTGTGGLSGLTYDPLAPSAAFTQKTPAQDAKAHVDGVLVTSASNTLTEAMTGVSITLLKPSDATVPSTTLTIGNDTAGMTKKLQSFVDSWNNLNSLEKTLTAYDPTAKTSSVLTGDGTVNSVRDQLRNILFSAPTGASTTYPTLADLGVSIQSDGSLKLDSTKLSTAIATNLSAVTSTVTAFGAAFKTAADAMTTTDGTIANRQSALSTIISDYDDRHTQMQTHLDEIQARYRKQFSALDTLMSQMQTQSAYLTQQLAKL